MLNKFALADNITRLYRYKTDEYHVDKPDEPYEVIDTSEYEWFEGLYFKTYEEALEALTAGEQAYIQSQKLKELTDVMRLRADIDFLAIMEGIEI